MKQEKYPLGGEAEEGQSIRVEGPNRDYDHGVGDVKRDIAGIGEVMHAGADIGGNVINEKTEYVVDEI